MSQAQPNACRRGSPWLALFNWVIMAYVGYFLLLGPVWAMDKRHIVRIPEPMYSLLWAPANLVVRVPVAGDTLLWYLYLWCSDPNWSYW